MPESRQTAWSALALVSLLLCFMVVTPPALAKTTATAVELAENAEKQTALVVRAARRSKDPLLAPAAPEAKPFWSALKTLNGAVTRLGNGASLKDDSFHKGLADTVSAAVAAIAAFELTGSKDKAVSTAFQKLEDTLGVLQKNFSKAAARQREGGKLSAAERQKLEQVKAKQADLEKRLKAIEPKVRGNKNAVRVIREVRDRSVLVGRAEPTVADFVATMVAIRIIDGILWGGHWWWGPWGGWYPDFSLGYLALHEGIIADIAYDWGYYDALEADLEDAVIEEEIDDAALIEEEDFLNQEVEDELDLEANLDLEGIEDPAPDDLDNPDFGLDEGDLMPGDGLPEDGAEADLLPDAPDDDPGDMAEPDAELLPEVEPDIMPEPEVMPEMPIDDGFDDAGGGFEDVGGGFDDFGGGFDDMGGGFDF